MFSHSRCCAETLLLYKFLTGSAYFCKQVSSCTSFTAQRFNVISSCNILQEDSKASHESDYSNDIVIIKKTRENFNLVLAVKQFQNFVTFRRDQKVNPTNYRPILKQMSMACFVVFQKLLPAGGQRLMSGYQASKCIASLRFLQ